MKKLFILFTSILALLSFSCNTDVTPSGTNPSFNYPEAPEVIPEGCIRINIDSISDWTLWAFKDFAEEEVSKCVTWPNGIPFMYKNGNFCCIDVKLAEAPKSLGIVVVNKRGIKTADEDIIFNFPSKYNEIFLKNGFTTVYIDKDLTLEPVGTTAAEIINSNTIKINCNGVKLNGTTVKLLDSNNNEVAITEYNETAKTITTQDDLKEKLAQGNSYKLTVTDPDGIEETVFVELSSALVNTWYGKTAKEKLEEAGAQKLGIALTGTTASFRTWAPISTKTQLLLFTSATQLSNPDSIIDMELEGNGLWKKENVDVTTYKYYKYRFENKSVTQDVADIWSYAASPDSVASQIVDINNSSEAKPSGWNDSYINPFKNIDDSNKSYTEAVIYEMHVRDWSKAFNKDGKFIDLADSQEFINHLKDLGVTHVQILPAFDYAETNNDSEYNWGYNPYHYNVPEGRYVKDMQDGTDAVKQFRQLIQKLHDNNIAINMDVVYNHTSGTGSNSLYDKTVPQYFYRMASGGAYSNGSGCGNEIATNNSMVLYYVIESLKHWMKDYHINGFRFDLMGCHETSTMKAIYDALKEIDPNVMVYGEPWTGGTSAVSGGVTKRTIDSCCNSTALNGVACFNDDYRNAIKGAEFGGFKQGHVQGVYDDNAIILGLKGSLKSKGFTNVLGRSINYVECHDNYTLFDKLAISYLGETEYSGDLYNAIGTKGINAVKAQNKLAAAYIFLSQGTPFINGGQEFMRSKQGDENSYKSPDSINAIDFSLKEKYSDVYNVYKGLISLRKSSDGAFGNNKEATAEVYNATKGVTKYTTGDFLVYFNATDSDVSIDTTGYTKLVDVTSGTPTENDSLPTSVQAKSFVILKK